MSEISIALDVDGVVASFVPSFLEEGVKIEAFPKNFIVDPALVTTWGWGPYREYVGPIWDHVMQAPYEFWSNLPVLEPAPFTPVAYVSARSFPAEVTEQWIKSNGLREAPVVHVPRGTSKVEVLRDLGVDLYVDDHLANFFEINTAGIPCLLMEAEHNRHVDVGEYRVQYLLEVKRRAAQIEGVPYSQN